MSRNNRDVPSSVPSHVVALYDYVPGQSDIDITTWSIQAPHLDMHLSFLKGETFKVIGDVDWWLYVTSNNGKTGYIPSILTAPLNYTNGVNTECCKVLPHHGDAPSYHINTEIDLRYFPDAPLDRDTELHHRKESPEGKAKIFSMLTFWWMTQLIWKGFRRPLITTDLWCLKNSLLSKNIGSKFDQTWKNEKEKVLRKLEKCQSGKMTAVMNGRTHEDEEKNLHDEVKYSSDERKELHPSLLKTVWKVFWPSLIPAVLFKLCSDACTFIQPQLLGAIVEFIDDQDKRALWEGLTYAVGMFTVAVCQTLVIQQYFKIVMVTGLRIRTAVLGIVYKKALVLSAVSRNQSTVGEMVNLMSVDAQRLMDILTYLNMLWSAPLQISLAIFFLYRAMGISVLAGVGVMMVLFPLSFCIGRRLRKFQVKQMSIKDLRIKLMNEILNGIKVLKLFAWETSFMSKVLEMRKDELRQLRIFSYLEAVHTLLMTSAPILVISLATFGTYVALGNTLTASKAFVALALFQILRFPLSRLATLLTNIIQALVSIKRLQKYLNMEELDPSHVERRSIFDQGQENTAIRITSGTFTWESEDKPTLKSINLKVEQGRLIAVVGHVGCGKSSLLSAMLGEIKKLEGSVYLLGSVAYVPQQAWIQNTTMRENILFGKTYDPKLYRKVISNCALIPDLEILPGGDMTEIGEKGINLSGGQKQRVSLARAVYNHGDVYLLDDPLSAVDSHVGKHIFDHVIGPKGMLKKKTRVLVTHQVRFLPQVDQIVVLRNGVITELGTYSELQANDGDFAEFLRTYAAEHEDEKEGFVARTRTISQLSTTSFTNTLSVTDRNLSIGSLISDSTQIAVEDYLVETKQQDKEDYKMITKEKAETGRIKFTVFSYYLISSGIPLFILVLFFLVCSETSQSGSRIWLAHWSSSNITENSEQNKYVGIYGALGVGQAFFLFLVSITLAYICVNGSTVLHEKLLANMLRLPLAFFETTPLGRIVNRFSKDIDVIDTLIPRALSWFLLTAVAILGTILIICYSTPLFMTVLLPLVVLYLIIQRLYVAASRQLQRLESISRSPIYSHFFETINGVSTIRAFGVQQRFISLNDVNVDENSMVKYPVILIQRWLAVRLEFIGNCVIFFAALFGVLARHSVESGLVGLSITVSLRITGTLNWMVRQTSELETHVVSVERVKEYTEAKQEASWNSSSQQPPDNWPDKGEIEFQQLGIRYREDLDLALKEIDCKICPNEKIGIVGRTGSGKSTLTLALFRILEATEGSIMIDGINISDIGLHDLRSKITIIPQDPILFSASLRFNLDPCEKHTDEEIWSALEVAHLKSFVSGLDNTLHYTIAEGGENLSVGQRQLVCLARALLRRSKILVLDEATAAVDLETDEFIQQTIRKEFSDCTLLTIAHRLNTIMDYTRIMVLSEGRIVEFDSPSNLLQLKGLFYNMAKDSNLLS